MTFLLRFIITLCFVSSLLACSGPEVKKQTTHKESTDAAITDEKKVNSVDAKQRAQEWLDHLGNDGLVLEHSEGKQAFKVKYNANLDSTTMRYQDLPSHWWVTLSIKGKLSKNTPLSVIQKNIKYVALDKLPTPGLVLNGWDVKPYTPTSSFKKGVEVRAYDGEMIALQVESYFFQLSGRDSSVVVPADAPMPSSAYFNIRQRFPLHLTIKAPIAFH